MRFNMFFDFDQRPKFGTLVFLFCAALSVQPNCCEADIVGANDPDFFPGNDGFNLTRDLDNQLDFLDLTKTIGFSFNEVSAEFGAGGVFEGYRYATDFEIFMLFESAGMSIVDINILTYTTGSFAEAQRLQNFLGVTAGVGTDFPFTQGISGTVSSPNRHFAPILGLDVRQPNQQFNRFDLEYTDNDSDPVIGSWLVKQSVPEPTSIPMLGFGLLLLGGIRRKTPN